MVVPLRLVRVGFTLLLILIPHLRLIRYVAGYGYLLYRLLLRCYVAIWLPRFGYGCITVCICYGHCVGPVRLRIDSGYVTVTVGRYPLRCYPLRAHIAGPFAPPLPVTLTLVDPAALRLRYR